MAQIRAKIEAEVGNGLNHVVAGMDGDWDNIHAVLWRKESGFVKEDEEDFEGGWVRYCNTFGVDSIEVNGVSSSNWATPIMAMHYDSFRTEYIPAFVEVDPPKDNGRIICRAIDDNTEASQNTGRTDHQL